MAERWSGLRLAVWLICTLVAGCWSPPAVFAEDTLYFPTISTPNCTIREPIYNHTFDLAGLRSALAHKVPLAGGAFLELNACGAIIKRCAGLTEATVCHTSATGGERVLGTNFALKLRDGQLQLELDGGKCNSTDDFRTRVQLVCSYAQQRRPFEVLSEAACAYGLVWYTELACMPLPVELRPEQQQQQRPAEACAVHDPKTGHVFDLSALAGRRNNGVIGRHNETFLLNVCKPVPYQYGGMCPPGSGACLKNNSATSLQEKFINIGTTAAKPIYENGVLFMHLLSDVRCNATHNISTHISFGCDTSSSMLGTPEFLNLHDCQYNFNWQTSLACLSTRPCVVVDPITQFTYDLSSLANRQFNVTNDKASTLTYRLGICNQAGAPCADGVGMCSINGTERQAALVPLGDFNVHMRYNQTGSPYLLYGSGGSVCGDIRRHWSARVEFVCATAGMTEGPVVVEENEDCTVVVHFVTKLVCQQQIACKANDWMTDVEYDLGALMRSTRNYVAAVDAALLGDSVARNQVFYLNVCRPLVPQYGLSCPAGSAACLATNDSSNPTHERSLGYADVSMTVVDTPHGRRPQLRYLRGAACPKDPHTELSAIIEFYCDYTARRGNPILREVHDDCQYRFEWPTNVICREHAVEFRAPGCELFSNDTNTVFDLKSISNNGSITIKHEPNAFDVHVCGNNVADGGSSSSSSIPGGRIPAGDSPLRSAFVNYAESSAKLFFVAAGPCAQKVDGNIQVELRIVCSATNHSSSRSDPDACTLVLIQETPHICAFLGIDMDGKVFDSETAAARPEPAQIGTSVLGTFLIVLLALGAVSTLIAGVVLVHRNPERRAQITGWLLRRSPATVQYSRVQQEPEASILLPQNGRLSDSDDELII